MLLPTPRSQMMMAYVKRQNLWLVGLLITWGTVSAAMAAVRNIPQFLLLRVLLGMFEAGALPALWSYLSHFYCKASCLLAGGRAGRRGPGGVMKEDNQWDYVDQTAEEAQQGKWRIACIVG